MNKAFGKKLCLDHLQRKEDQEYILGQYPCHPTMVMSQVYIYFNHNVVGGKN